MNEALARDRNEQQARAQIRLRVSATNREEALDILRSILEPTRTELGCLSTHLVQDLEDDSWIGVIGSWRTKADLVRHLRSERFRRVLAALELSECPPKVEFQMVSSTAGLDLIEAARGNEPHGTD